MRVRRSAATVMISYLVLMSALSAFIPATADAAPAVPTPASAAPVAAAPVAGTPGTAQSFASLAVDIWPEHDDPRLLVIYRGTLGAGVALPATLTFVVHPSAQVNAAAYRGDDGQLLTTPHQYQQEANRLLVSITIPRREFQFEYYADTISGPPPQRAFALELAFPLAVDNLRVSVEQPLRSSAFALDPAATEKAVTPAGFTHHAYAARAWPLGKVWRVSGRYRKEDGNPSVPRAAQVSAPGPPAVPPREIARWWWGVALAVAAAGVAGLIFIRHRRRTAALPRPRGAARPRSRDGARHDTQRVSCSNCGARTRPRDRYCSRCGTGLGKH